MALPLGTSARSAQIGAELRLERRLQLDNEAARRDRY